jgi:hypothetical protein
MSERGPAAPMAGPRMPRFEPTEAWDPRFLEGSPELASVERAAERLRDFDDWPTVLELDARLGGLAGIRFVEQAAKKKRRRRDVPVDADALYDGRITLEGFVPTRARSWHDVMNALVWASFPIAKRALHRRQYAAAKRRIGEPRRRLPGTRTPEEDALTMLDEGGELSIVEETVGPDAVASLAPDAAAPRLVFGHALLEHALVGCRTARPRKVVLRLDQKMPEDLGALRVAADRALASWLESGRF